MANEILKENFADSHREAVNEPVKSCHYGFVKF